MPGNGSVKRQYPEIVAALGQNLRAAREQAGLSQETVAKHTGIQRSALSEVENGNRNLLAVELWALATLYNVSADWLLGTPPILNTLSRNGISDVLDNLQRLIVHSSRDWGAYGRDAWLYGVLVGWECEDSHEHDWICQEENVSLTAMAERFGWHEDYVARLRRYRTIVRGLQTPDQPTRKPTATAD